MKDQIVNMLREHLMAPEDTAKIKALIANSEEIGRFLLDHMDELASEERKQIYGMLRPIIPTYAEAILNERIKIENDPLCKRVLNCLLKGGAH